MSSAAVDQQQQTSQSQTQTSSTSTTSGGGQGARPALRGLGYQAGRNALRPDEPGIVSELKTEFGALLGIDLSGVNVVLGQEAGGSGCAHNGEVRLSVGPEALREQEGRWLFAHELVHIAQGKTTGEHGDEADCEVEAEELASRLVAGSRAQVKVPAPPGVPLYHKAKKGSWHLLSWSQKQSAIKYNRKRGLKKWKIRRFQNLVGVKDDGVIGPITVAAIARWQSFHGLAVDGKIGPNTHSALQAHMIAQNKGSKKDADSGSGKKNEPKLKGGQLSAHFALSEFASKDGAGTPKSVVANLKKLAKELEVLRAATGGKAISITSGYRSPSHNAAVGGATKSRHMTGQAADIVVSGMSASAVYNLISKLISQGKMKEGGLGRYSSFTHYDIRGYRARW